MSTSYSKIYNSFLTKITDYDLPQLTDDELSEYCKELMDSAIVKIPMTEHDLSAREIEMPDIIQEIDNPTDDLESIVGQQEQQESQNDENGEGDQQTEEVVEEPKPTIAYVIYFEHESYGGSTIEIPDLNKTVENNATFTIFIQVTNYIKMLSFVCGAPETKDCKVQAGLTCTVSYDGENTLTFANVIPRTIPYRIMYITYTTPKAEQSSDTEIVPQPVEVSGEVSDAIKDESELKQEEVFTDDLSDLEIDIIACQMVVEWVERKLHNTQLLHMFAGTKDESMASQANHMKEMIELKEKQRATVSMLMRDYAYQKWIQEENS